MAAAMPEDAAGMTMRSSTCERVEPSAIAADR